MVKERLALLAIALEQSVVDKGDWSIAYLLSLASDPPSLDVPRSDKCGESLQPSVLAPGTSELGYSSSSLRQRTRSSHEQKARRFVAEKAAEITNGESFSKEKAAKVSKGSKRGPRRKLKTCREEISSDLPQDEVSRMRPDAVLQEEPDLFQATISLPKWCQCLVTSVFRTRASFSAFVRHAIRLPRDSSKVSSSPAFPIPIPYFGVFDRMPSGLSLARRNRIHFRRAVVLVVLALNFWWSGNRFVPDDLLRRVPSSAQKAMISRVVDFMQVDGQMLPTPIVASGRRFPQLIAILSELSSALTSVGAQSSPYAHVFEGCPSGEVAVNNEVAEELTPYRSLQASRLKLVGSGLWDPLPFLDDNLAMAFANPDSLLYECDYTGVSLPKLDDPPSEILVLAKRWDDLDLLFLHPHPVQQLFPEQVVRIFNCYKNRLQDRQIGDRRGRNWSEMAVFGPSKSLPMGSDIFELFLDPAKQLLSVSITDRSDFYHQFRVSPTRAVSNTLNVGFPPEAFEGTKALAFFNQSRRDASLDRMKVGDGLGLSSRFPKTGRKKPPLLFPAFRSILQGDHGGVEYACQSHAGLLESYGLLARDNRLVATRPYRGSSIMEGLVIDD